MEEPRREKVGFYVGTAFTIIPAMIASGFMPEWDVLPFGGWLALAVVGGAAGGAIATSRTASGAACGALAGLGAVLGVYVYVLVRAALVGESFFRVELVIGALIGAAPGMLAFQRWARDRLEVAPELQ